MGMAQPTATALLAEVWTEYGISMLVIFLRFFARWRMFGFHSFDLGDLFAGFATVCYTLSTTGIYLTTTLGNNIGLDDTTAMQVPDDELHSMELGSKLMFITWYCYITLLWSLKGVLLMVYVKLGSGISQQQHIIKGVCGFVFLCYFSSIMCHTLVCTPPWRSWQVQPFPGHNCTLRKPNYIVIAILNALSDLTIIAVPMPLLFRMKVVLSRKLALIALFSLGLFCITATILRAYYSLSSLDTLSIALGWASRETFVGTIVACAPGIKPLLSSENWLRATSQSRSRERLSTTPTAGSAAGSGGGDDQNSTTTHDIKGPKDGTITISRSVDVTHSEHRPSVDAYAVEMARWKSKYPAESLESDERGMIVEEDELEEGTTTEIRSKKSHQSQASHRSTAQYSLREFFLSEAKRGSRS